MSNSDQRGFTLIEVIIIIVVRGIIAAVSTPKFQSIHIESQKSSVKGSLGGFRSAIHLWRVKRATNTLAPSWPDLGTLSTIGQVMSQDIPENPFRGGTNSPDSIVEGITKGQIVGTRGGWAYNPSNGEIWANTGTLIPGSGCSGPQNISENTW